MIDEALIDEDDTTDAPPQGLKAISCTSKLAHAMRASFRIARHAPLGMKVGCPGCGNLHVKHEPHAIFCGSRCKARFLVYTSIRGKCATCDPHVGKYNHHAAKKAASPVDHHWSFVV